MSYSQSAAAVAAALCLRVLAFQVLLASGLPLGRAAWVIRESRLEKQDGKVHHDPATLLLAACFLDFRRPLAES